MRSSLISDPRKETKPIFDSYQKKLLFLELRKKIQKTQIDFPPIKKDSGIKHKAIYSTNKITAFSTKKEKKSMNLFLDQAKNIIQQSNFQKMSQMTIDNFNPKNNNQTNPTLEINIPNFIGYKSENTRQNSRKPLLQKYFYAQGGNLKLELGQNKPQTNQRTLRNESRYSNNVNIIPNLYRINLIKCRTGKKILKTLNERDNFAVDQKTNFSVAPHTDLIYKKSKREMFGRRSFMINAPVIILYLDGIFIDIGSNNIFMTDGVLFYIRSEMTNIINKLKLYFQVVAITSFKKKQFEIFKSEFNKRSIVFDAIYRYKKYKPTAFDISHILLDFQITSSQKLEKVLIVCPLNIPYKDLKAIKKNESILLSKKCNINHGLFFPQPYFSEKSFSPVPSKNHPIVLLIPTQICDDDFKSLDSNLIADILLKITVFPHCDCFQKLLNDLFQKDSDYISYFSEPIDIQIPSRNHSRRFSCMNYGNIQIQNLVKTCNFFQSFSYLKDFGYFNGLKVIETSCIYEFAKSQQALDNHLEDHHLSLLNKRIKEKDEPQKLIVNNFKKTEQYQELKNKSLNPFSISYMYNVNISLFSNNNILSNAATNELEEYNINNETETKNTQLKSSYFPLVGRYIIIYGNKKVRHNSFDQIPNEIIRLIINIFHPNKLKK